MVNIQSATAKIRRGKRRRRKKKRPQDENIMPHLLCRVAMRKKVAAAEHNPARLAWRPALRDVNNISAPYTNIGLH